jgi:hypothetical protein
MLPEIQTLLPFLPLVENKPDENFARSIIDAIREEKARWNIKPFNETTTDQNRRSLTVLLRSLDQICLKPGNLALEAYKRSISTVVEPIFKRYGVINSTLELASGTFPIREFLINTPLEKKNLIHLSDITSSCVDELKVKFPKATVYKIDSTQIKLVSNQRYHTVVMTDLFNVISHEKIKKSLQQINNILEPGGHFINFFVRDILYTQAYIDLLRDDEIIIPIVNSKKQCVGLQTFDRGQFESSVKKSCVLMPDVKDMLLEISMMTATDSYPLFVNLYSHNPQWLIEISKAVDSIPCPTKNEVDLEAYLYDKLKKLMLEENFEILIFEEFEGGYLGKRSGEVQLAIPDSNYFHYDKGLDFDLFLGALAPNMIMEKANVFTIVCKKPDKSAL